MMGSGVRIPLAAPALRGPFRTHGLGRFVAGLARHAPATRETFTGMSLGSPITAGSPARSKNSIALRDLDLHSAGIFRLHPAQSPNRWRRTDATTKMRQARQDHHPTAPNGTNVAILRLRYSR